MLLLKYIIFNFLLLSVINHTPKDKDIFVPPVKIPVYLSSNFGELRIDHFHSGIDIKTQGVTGKEIVSCADGFIYRIGVSPTGFGKALYIKHESGYSTVYAHLDRFTPAVESWVRAAQYERKSFAVTLFPAKETFPVKQGELIAWSGNSGSSGGPHLHFEIRKSENELPVNPLLFNIGASDNIAPVIERLAIYPLSNKSRINGNASRVILNAKGSHGNYTLGEQELVINGRTGFGIKLHDLISGSSNKCAAYSIVTEIDSIPVFNYVMDGFAFTESRYVNSHMDYKTWREDNIRIQRTFVLPNDKLTTYKTLLNRGIYNFNDDKVHNVTIRVADAHGNKSTLSFKVRSSSAKAIPTLVALKETDEKTNIMPYNRANTFSAADILVNIPSGALYDTLKFSYRKSPGTSLMYSDIHSVHDNNTPVHRAYSISVKPNTIPFGKESKLLIVQLNDNMSKTPLNSSFRDGFLKADVMSFGRFYAGIDTISPSITASGLHPGIDLTGRKEIRFRIKDDFSGIKSYECLIDGKWALMEYDPKNELLIYPFDEKYLTLGTKHNLSLKVIDNKDNESTYQSEFTW